MTAPPLAACATRGQSNTFGPGKLCRWLVTWLGSSGFRFGPRVLVAPTRRQSKTFGPGRACAALDDRRDGAAAAGPGLKPSECAASSTHVQRRWIRQWSYGHYVSTMLRSTHADSTVWRRSTSAPDGDVLRARLSARGTRLGNRPPLASGQGLHCGIFEPSLASLARSVAGRGVAHGPWWWCVCLGVSGLTAPPLAACATREQSNTFGPGKLCR